jgi:hypothetical protein
MTGDVEASGKGTAVAFHCASSPSTRSVAILTPPIGVASSADCGDRQGCRTDFASRWCLRCTIRASCRTCRGLCIWDHRRKPVRPMFSHLSRKNSVLLIAGSSDPSYRDSASSTSAGWSRDSATRRWSRCMNLRRLLVSHHRPWPFRDCHHLSTVCSEL